MSDNEIKNSKAEQRIKIWRKMEKEKEARGDNKIIQISGIGFKNKEGWILAGLTQDNNVIVTRGDGEWWTINPV